MNNQVVMQSYQRAIEQQAVVISNIVDMAANDVDEPLPRLIIAVPVSSIQAMKSDDIRAAVIAVINPENNLYKLLLKEWVTTKTEESLLVLLADNSVNYLSPLKHGYKVFHRQARAKEDSQDYTAEADVANRIGDFSVLPDYRHTPVPVSYTHLTLPTTPYV